MKFLADECCDASLVRALRSDGHDVTYVVEHGRGSLDDDLLNQACAERRVLLTEDKDFGQLVYQLRKPCYGVMLLRFDPGQTHAKVSRARQVIEQEGERLTTRFVTVEADRHRSRPVEPMSPS